MSEQNEMPKTEIMYGHYGRDGGFVWSETKYSEDAVAYARVPDGVDNPVVVSREWLRFNSENDKERAKEYHATIATLTAELARLRRVEQAAKTAMEELDNMATQYGCDCGHPACRPCRDTQDARAAHATLAAAVTNTNASDAAEKSE